MLHRAIKARQVRRACEEASAMGKSVVTDEMIEAARLEEQAMADRDAMRALDAAIDHRAISQRFFAQLAQSVLTPHVGDAYRECVKAVLLRAEESNLYSPTGAK